MIFPYDSNSRFSDPKAASPTQRPASNSDARKRDHSSGFSPVDATFERESAGSDAIREAVARAYADLEGEDWSMGPVTDEAWPAMRQSYLRKADRIIAAMRSAS